MRVLIVEDERRLAEALAQIMCGQKYLTDVVDNGEDALHYVLNDEYDVMVLDAMLPKRSGFDVVKVMREKKNVTPVIMLTAKDEVGDKIRGLDCGADDYMTKPFAPEELLARVRALSRRRGEVVLDELGYGDLQLSLSTSTLSCGEKSVRLGFKEVEVLRILLGAPHGTTPKEELILKVWGANSNAEDNNVEAYISFLRKKFFFLNSRVGIETIRKVGYRLTDEAEAGQFSAGGKIE